MYTSYAFTHAPVRSWWPTLIVQTPFESALGHKAGFDAGEAGAVVSGGAECRRARIRQGRAAYRADNHAPLPWVSCRIDGTSAGVAPGPLIKAAVSRLKNSSAAPQGVQPGVGSKRASASGATFGWRSSLCA
jgi:hypothetical protein